MEMAYSLDRRRITSVTPLQWTAVLLAVISALVHLALGVQFVPATLGILFVLAGVGFLVGIAVALLSPRRDVVAALGIPYTGVQIVLWYVIQQPTLRTLSTPEIIDKVAQVGLIVLLAVIVRRERA